MNLTALIAVRDREHNLMFCLASINACKPRPHVVLVDYGSKVSLKSLEDVYPWLHVVRVESGKSPFNKSAALNIGLRHVVTRWVCATDADQVFQINFFGAVEEALKKKPKCMVICRTWGLQSLPDGFRPSDIPAKLPGLFNLAHRGRLYGEGCCNAMDSEWARDIGGWDENFNGWGGEDSDFMRRGKQCGLVWHRIEEATEQIHLPHVRSGAYYAKTTVAENRAYYHRRRSAGRVLAVNARGPKYALSMHRGAYFEMLGEKLGMKFVQFPAAKLAAHGMPKDRVHTELILLAGEYRPEFIFSFKDECPSAQTINEIKSVSPGTKFVLMFGDYREKPHEMLVRMQPHIDVLLLTSQDAGQRSIYSRVGYKRIGFYYGTVGPQSAGLKPQEYEPNTIFFGGNRYPGQFPLSGERDMLLRAVHNAFGKALRMRGTGWESGYGSSPMVKGLPYHTEIRKHTLSLGINHYDGRKYYSGRTIISVSMGRLHITRYIPGMEEDFQNHYNIVWFNSIPEALDVIRFYLQHDEARERVRRRQSEAAERMFSFDADSSRVASQLRRMGVLR